MKLSDVKRREPWKATGSVSLAGSIPALSLLLMTMNAEMERATTRELGGDLIGKIWLQFHYLYRGLEDIDYVNQ